MAVGYLGWKTNNLMQPKERTWTGAEDTDCFWRSPLFLINFFTTSFTSIANENSAFCHPSVYRLVIEVEFSFLFAKASFNRLHRTTLKRPIFDNFASSSSVNPLEYPRVLRGIKMPYCKCTTHFNSRTNSSLLNGEKTTIVLLLIQKSFYIPATSNYCT